MKGLSGFTLHCQPRVNLAVLDMLLCYLLWFIYWVVIKVDKSVVVLAMLIKFIIV